MPLFFKRLMAYLPTNLPVGMTEFNDWSDSIIALSGKYADEDSMKWALATMVLHGDASSGRLSKIYFVHRLRKTAANQVASAVFQDIKLKQEAAAKQTAEATASPEDAALNGKES